MDTGFVPRLAPRRPPAHVFWLLVLTWCAALLPPQVRVTIGGFELYSYRLCFILFLPFVIRRYARGESKFSPVDILILLAGGWIAVGMVVNHGLATGLVRGLSVVLDAISGYLIARSSIRSTDDLRRVLIVMAPVFLITGLLVMAESLSHQLIVRPIADLLFGRQPSAEIIASDLSQYSPRLGLFRGAGTFPHPILAGLCLATLLPVYQASGLRGWPRTAGIGAALLAFFTISSTAFLTLFLSAGFLTYDMLTRRVRGIRWAPLIAALIILGLVLQFGSSGGLLKVSMRFALDGGTAYYRYLQWVFAGQSLNHHPIFGLGESPYDRPIWMLTTSIDSQWLLIAVRYGYMAVFLMLGATIHAITAVSLASGGTAAVEAKFLRGVAISITVMAIGMVFVALFGGSQVWFTILLGCGVSCAQSRSTVPHRALAEAPIRPLPSLRPFPLR